MFARWPAPSTDKVTESMESLLQLLQMSAHISGAHTVEFYTEDIWKNNVGVSPESVLSIFSQQRRSPYQFTAAPDMTSIFSPATNQLVNLESFVEAARYNSLMNLGLCTTIDEILETFASQRTDKRGKGIKSDQFMNDKKSHEVVIMSQLVEALAKLCGVKQVIDLGAGKGYLSSYLSMRYDLKVYGIDSSHTNTDGANERNRKLKKYWQVYKTDARTTSKAQKSNQKKGLLPKSSCQDVNANKDISIQSGSEIRLSNSEPCIDNELRLISDSSKWASNKESNQAMGNPETDNSLDSAFSFLDILPAGAVEVPSVSQSVSKVLSEQEKEHRKMENIKAKKLPESHVYSPLTSYVTADTELHDIVTDLEESIMVGLHTCGDLAPNTLRIFTSKPEMKAVCSVGCCYHFLSEQFEHLEEDPTEGLWGFPMSQYLKERCWHIGRNARMSACLLSDQEIMGYYQKYELRRNELEAFNRLKVFLAPCVEALILLDRLSYLREQENLAWSGLVKLFDPVKSPRCYAVVSLKQP
ncbi:probable methyltransferase-like protein 25 isoform X4 [Dendrobates tinctorius]|uniref:probable methyltransferase-like protein 25 isoform X4 n=1 Tax=Dendrobates tinctorius TaxID=92724 RepID=UPI003CC964CD